MSATRFSTSRMLSNAKAIEYIYRVTTGRHPRTITRKEEINNRPCLVIDPADRAGKRTVLCVHGMSVKGYEDPRMLNVARAMAAIGYRAVIPSYPEIQDLMIDPTSADRIRSDIVELSRQSGSQIGIFTASFSGGLSLIAASHPSVADKISSMLVVGSYASVDTTLEFFLHREEMDPYGLFIIFKNFLPYLNEPAALIEAFDIAAKDDGFQRVDGELEPFLAGQSRKVRDLYRRYIEDSSFRLAQWEKISRIPEALRIFQSMDVLRVCGGLKAAICLLHGAHDIVIPPEESVLLKQSLAGRIPVSLTVTSILDHGNVKVGISMARETLSLVQTFGLFFRSLDSGRTLS